MSTDAILHLAVQYASRGDCPTRAQVRRWAKAAADAAANGQTVEILVRFVGRREARRLNRDFRGRDYATNVLTFGYDDSPSLSADLVICVPVIRDEARTQRKPVRSHFAHMIVHGVMHACGFDHEVPSQALVMERLEAKILARFRIPDPYL